MERMRSRSPRRERLDFDRLVDILRDVVPDAAKRTTLRECIDDDAPSFASCAKVRRSCINNEDPVGLEDLEDDCVGLQDGESDRYHCFNQSTIARLLAGGVDAGSPPLNPLTRRPFLQGCSLFNPEPIVDSPLYDPYSPSDGPPLGPDFEYDPAPPHYDGVPFDMPEVPSSSYTEGPDDDLVDLLSLGTEAHDTPDLRLQTMPPHDGRYQ